MYTYLIDKMNYKTPVTKSNSLTKASFSMTLDQKRIVLACIAQITDPRLEITRDDAFTVTAPEICTLFGIDLKSAYTQLKEATLRDKINRSPGRLS